MCALCCTIPLVVLHGPYALDWSRPWSTLDPTIEIPWIHGSMTSLLLSCTVHYMHPAGSIARSHYACGTSRSTLLLYVLLRAPMVHDHALLGSLHPEIPGSMIQTISHIEIPWIHDPDHLWYPDLILISWMSVHAHMRCIACSAGSIARSLPSTLLL